MKFKTSGKQIKDNYHKIIGTGYCTMQSLLTFQEPIAYSSGVYGWNCDYYNIDGVIICTGYRHTINQNAKLDYKTIDEYEKKADRIAHDYKTDYDERREQVNTLLKELISKS